MLESELLRQEKSLEFNIDLEKYKWSKKLEERIFSIKLDLEIEDNQSIITMKDVYELGLNIGMCGLTSRYLAIEFPEAEMHKGTSDLVIGTPGAPEGEHAWITIGDKIIDSTLMIEAPVKDFERFYHIEATLHPDSARKLSMYEQYSHHENLKAKSKSR